MIYDKWFNYSKCRSAYANVGNSFAWCAGAIKFAKQIHGDITARSPSEPHSGWKCKSSESRRRVWFSVDQTRRCEQPWLWNGDVLSLHDMWDSDPGWLGCCHHLPCFWKTPTTWILNKPVFSGRNQLLSPYVTTGARTWASGSSPPRFLYGIMVSPVCLTSSLHKGAALTMETKRASLYLAVNGISL